MDSHVRHLGKVLESIAPQVEGEMYETQSTDDQGRLLEMTPALRGRVDGKSLNVVLYDVPGPRDHFTIIVDASPLFSLSLHKEGRWDWLWKTLGKTQDHIIGVADFDREWVIGGNPKTIVVAYLRRDDVRQALGELGTFLHLSADHGHLKATYPVTPDTYWKPMTVLRNIKTLARLAGYAERMDGL